MAFKAVSLVFVPLWGKGLGPEAGRPGTSLTTVLLHDLQQGSDQLPVSFSLSVRFLNVIYEVIKVSESRASQ